jgi:hypothetical protein
MRFARAAFVLCTAAIASAGRIPSELFPPETRMVIGISVRSLLASPLFEAAGGGAALIPPGSLFAGIDLAKDIEEVVIASEGDTKDAPTIAVIRGRLRLDRSKATIHDGIPVFREASAAIALLDSETAIAGSPDDVLAALGRRGRSSALSSDLAARIAAVAGGNDFWAVGNPPEPKSGGPSIDRFDFSGSLRDGLDLHGSVRLKSSQEAAQFAMFVQMFQAMLNSQPSKSAAKFDLRAEGSTIRLDVFIPQSELKRTVPMQKEAIARVLQGRASTPAAASVPAPPRDPVSSPPSAPAVIVTNAAGETVHVTLPGGK